MPYPHHLVQACNSIVAWGSPSEGAMWNEYDSAIELTSRYGNVLWRGEEKGSIEEIHVAGNMCWALVNVKVAGQSDSFYFARLGGSCVDMRSPVFNGRIVTLGDTYWLITSAKSGDWISEFDPTTWKELPGRWALPDSSGFVVEMGGQVWASKGDTLMRLDIPLTPLPNLHWPQPLACPAATPSPTAIPTPTRSVAPAPTRTPAPTPSPSPVPSDTPPPSPAASPSAGES